jgi:hypothetical protein
MVKCFGIATCSACAVIKQTWLAKGATEARELTARPTDEKIKMSRLACEVIEALQRQNADVFTPNAAYDGNKILYARHQLSLNRDEASVWICTSSCSCMLM